MLVIGLTGGIGCGKTAVARLFSERGIPIIDADVIARQLTLPHKFAFNEIVNRLGNDILATDGTLDRTKLRSIIFQNAKQRRWLEDLLHPLIKVEMEKSIKNLHAPYCIAVIPLLLEVEFYSVINRILVVDTLPELQIERITKRDNMPKEDIEQILRVQASRERRLARAQDVIINNTTFEDLIPQVDLLHKKYLSHELCTRPKG